MKREINARIYNDNTVMVGSELPYCGLTKRQAEKFVAKRVGEAITQARTELHDRLEITIVLETKQRIGF